MKIENKISVRVEMEDLETQRKLKQTFSHLKAGQSEEAILELSEIVGSLTKDVAVVGATYQVVEYRVTAGN